MNGLQGWGYCDDDDNSEGDRNESKCCCLTKGAISGEGGSLWRNKVAKAQRASGYPLKMNSLIESFNFLRKY